MNDGRTSPFVRAALVAVAIAVIGWLAIGLRSAIPETRAQEIVRTRLEGGGTQRALRLYREARDLNPDTGPQVEEGALLLVIGRPRAAARTVEPVVSKEPANASAWAVLAGAYRRFDPRRAATAQRRLRRLRPPVPG